jgi:SAM-dependent methyltransferase
MSPTVLEERPSLITPVQHEEPHPCEKDFSNPLNEPLNWISRAIQKSYLNSFNYCLRELGWVPQSILEVGSGDGSLLGYTAKQFFDAEVVGVEFDPFKVALAKNNVCCRVEFIELLDAETLPFESGKFDVVISHGFLGHSPLPRHWMKEMARVSAEALILSAPTPVGHKWLSKIPGAEKARLLGNPVFASDTHPISTQKMRDWVERLGFKAETIATPLPYTMMLARKPQENLDARTYFNQHARV